MKEIIHTDNAPAAIGTYSQAVKVDKTIYASGQIGMDTKGELVSDDVEKQLEQVFINLKSVLNESGADFKDVVKFTVYLQDFNDFAKVNTVMAKYVDEPYPARVAIQAARLPKDAAVEIDAIAVVD